MDILGDVIYNNLISYVDDERKTSKKLSWGLFSELEF